MSLNPSNLILCCWIAFTFLGCPEPITDSSDPTNPLAALEGTWAGELSCYEEGTSSTGEASLTLNLSNDKAVGTITFSGNHPSEFTATAQLGLWRDEGGALDGAWSDCDIEGGTYGNGSSQLTCHFWHQTQDNGYVFKPNLWELNEEQSVLSLIEKPDVESEAQKCHGTLNKI